MNHSVACEQEVLEKFDDETEENIKNFERELIENPKTRSEIISNRKTEKKIKFAKAIALVKSGRAKSYHAAAKKYGVNYSSVRRFYMSGGSFKGKGATLTRFTIDEEKVIVDRALKLTSSEGKARSYIKEGEKQLRTKQNCNLFNFRERSLVS